MTVSCLFFRIVSRVDNFVWEVVMPLSHDTTDTMTMTPKRMDKEKGKGILMYFNPSFILVL
jgi:hypothetical protein